MESKALKEYKTPDYPRKEDVQAQPSLLRRSFCRRWQKLLDMGVSGMLVAGLSLSTCDDIHAATPATQNSPTPESLKPENYQVQSVTPQNIFAIVAPIFEHGKGRGTTGCLAVAPPAFLSEDEALVVIKEELAKYGIKLNKEKVLINEVTLSPGKDELFGGLSEKRRKRIQDNLRKAGSNIEIIDEKPLPLEIDLQDKEKSINIEYISENDYFKMGGDRSNSTVQSYEIKKIAQQVRNKVQADAKQGIYGVFYDPVIRNKYGEMLSEELIKSKKLDTYKKMRNAKENELTDEEKRLVESIRKKSFEPAKELLREQVKDFAKWLKEQGVIK